jgi:hypothetical protein
MDGNIDWEFTSGQLRAASGGASAPGVSYFANPGQGMFYAGSNLLGWSTSSTERMRLSNTALTLASGVGLVTTENIDLTGTSAFRSAGSGAATPGFSFLTDPGKGLADLGSNLVGLSISSTEKLRLASTAFTLASGVSYNMSNADFNMTGTGNAYINGSLAVGTTTPSAKLHVAGGDVAITNQSSGVILRATDGANCFRHTVDNLGIPSYTSVTCPTP